MPGRFMKGWPGGAVDPASMAAKAENGIAPGVLVAG